MTSNEENNEKPTKIELDLCNFRPDRILSNNTRGKTIAILGKFEEESEQQGIVILEKKAFTKEQIFGKEENGAGESEGKEKEETNGENKEALDASHTTTSLQLWQHVQELKKEFTNDIYTNATLLLDPSINTIKTTIIYPATELHIKKYSGFNLFIVQETWEDFKEITEPYLNEHNFSLEVRIFCSLNLLISFLIK